MIHYFKNALLKEINICRKWDYSSQTVWHWNSMATLRQACRRLSLRKLSLCENSGLFSNSWTENAIAVSVCGFASLSKVHQNTEQLRGENNSRLHRWIWNSSVFLTNCVSFIWSENLVWNWLKFFLKSLRFGLTPILFNSVHSVQIKIVA